MPAATPARTSVGVSSITAQAAGAALCCFAARRKNDFQALRHGAADELFEHILKRYRNPQLIQHLREYSIGDQLAVHQHAVAIEDDQAEFLINHPTAASCNNMSAMKAKHFSTTALAVQFSLAWPAQSADAPMHLDNIGAVKLIIGDVKENQSYFEQMFGMKEIDHYSAQAAYDEPIMGFDDGAQPAAN